MVVVRRLSKLRRIKKLEYVTDEGDVKAIYQHYAILLNMNRKVDFE